MDGVQAIERGVGSSAEAKMEHVVDFHRGEVTLDALTDFWIEGKGNGSTASITAEYDILCIKEG